MVGECVCVCVWWGGECVCVGGSVCVCVCVGSVCVCGGGVCVWEGQNTIKKRV